MSGWFYIKPGILDDTQEGPLDDNAFLKLFFNGELKPAKTKVHHPVHTNGQWVLADQIPSITKQVEAGQKQRQQQAQADAKAKAEAKAQAADQAKATAAAKARADAVARAEAETQRPPPLQKREPIASVEKGELPPFKPRAYPAMRAVCSLLYIAAFLSLLVFLGLFLRLLALLFWPYDDPEFNSLILVIPMSSCLATSLSCMYAAEFIRVMMDIQENTQMTAYYTRNGRP